MERLQLPEIGVGGAAEKLFSGHCTHDLEAAVTACTKPVQNPASHHFSVGGGQLHMWLGEVD